MCDGLYLKEIILYIQGIFIAEWVPKRQTVNQQNYKQIFENCEISGWELQQSFISESTKSTKNN